MGTNGKSYCLNDVDRKVRKLQRDKAAKRIRGVKKPCGAKKRYLRNTSYRVYYTESILEFFKYKPTQVLRTVITKPDGTERVEEKLVAADIPLFEKWMADNEVGHHAYSTWIKTFPEFEDAVERCKQLQKSMMIQNGLKSLYNPAAFIFTAKNITDMRDNVDLTSKGESLKPMVYIPDNSRQVIKPV